MTGNRSRFPFSSRSIERKYASPSLDRNIFLVLYRAVDTLPEPTKYVIIGSLLQPDGGCIDWLRFEFRMASPLKTRCDGSSERYNRKTSSRKSRNTPSI